MIKKITHDLIPKTNKNSQKKKRLKHDCNSSGSVTLLAGDNKTCTLINTYIPPVPVISSGGGGGGGSLLSIDNCSNGDYSYSYYDGICGVAPIITANVPIIVPLIGILKVPSPLALPNGSGSVTYNYTVWNVGGKQALANINVVDDKCSPLALISGDLNNNNKLDPTESWKYSCTTKLLSTTINTAVATGYSDDIYHTPTIATAIATVVVGAPLTPPLINIVKVPSRLTPFPFGGGNVTYTYTVTNPGLVAIHNLVVKDDKCSHVSYVSGNTNNNTLLDPGETLIYTCQTNVSVSTRNIATAEGNANGFTTRGYAFANVLVSVPSLPNTGISPENNNTPWNIIIFSGFIILISTSLIVNLKKYI